jgi:hypothetical protein
MLIYCVRKLCKDFYVKPKQSALQMLNTMDAMDFNSFDEHHKPSFIHLDNLIPFVTSVLINAEQFNRTDSVIITTVEGIIHRSGNLMKEYATVNDNAYRPEWAGLSALKKCTAVLDYLSSQAKESFMREMNTSIPIYVPPTYSSTVNGYMRPTTNLIEDHLLKKKLRYAQRGEPIKGNVAVVEQEEEYTPLVELFDISSTDNYYQEETPTPDEIYRYQEAVNHEVTGIMNSGQIVPDDGRRLSEQICPLCGCEDHAETECFLRLKYLPINYSPTARNARTPLCIWKYAGLRNSVLRANLLSIAEKRGFFSLNAENRALFAKFKQAVETSAADEARKYDIKQLEWRETNADKYKKQLEDEKEKEKKYTAPIQKGSHYGPSVKGKY